MPTSSKPSPTTSSTSRSSSTAVDKIHQLIKLQDWEALRDVLKETLIKSSTTSSSRAVKAACITDEQTLLYAIKYDAPHHIVRKLVDIRPDLMQQKDSKSGQTPLHVLCRRTVTRESQKIISLISEEYPRAAIIMDAQGMTPLHLICKNPCNSSRVVSAIEALCQAAPSVLIMTNKDGETPMEVFLMSQKCQTVKEEECQNMVLRLFQKASAKYLSSTKMTTKGEMYRLKCRQQDLFIQS